jgi:hypothetical protein
MRTTAMVFDAETAAPIFDLYKSKTPSPNLAELHTRVTGSLLAGKRNLIVAGALLVNDDVTPRVGESHQSGLP